MKNVLALILLILPLLASADFDYSLYHKENIQKAIENMEIDPKVDYWIEGGEYKYEVLVNFTGERRNLSKETKMLLELWVKAWSLDINVSEVFSSEIEFEQNGVKYFFPVQEVLMGSFSNEIAMGGKVSLYIMACGAIKQRPIFIINEFKAL